MKSGAEAPPLVVERRRQAVFVTLNRPDAANALSRRLVAELTGLCADLAREIAGGADIRLLVLTGAGPRAFSAGADLKERRGWTLDDTRLFLGEINALMNAVAVFPRPTIAAINGSAFGGGFELALACDVRIAAETAEMGLTEVRLGIIPGAGGTQRLPRVVGEGRAKELVLLPRRLTADEALAWGLVNRVSQPGVDVVDDAVAWLAPVAEGAPIAQAAALEAIDRAFDVSLDVGIDLERVSYEKTLASEDRAEALAAFAEKRKPRFKGR